MRFNYTGSCVPGKHFMVDTSKKLELIITHLIEAGEYFAINRPRQFGKTTTMNLLELELEKRGYLPVFISFEGIGDAVFESEKCFSNAFVDILVDALSYDYEKLSEMLESQREKVIDYKTLSNVITAFIKEAGKEVVLMINEVDKSSNNQPFVSFLGMLRDKYLLRNEGEDETFHSVILAGVHDVKNMKVKVRPDEEQKINSPWNIAVDFTINLAFSAKEIETMLVDYSTEKKIGMDIPAVAERLYYFTSGYPFLVSKLCYIIDTYIIEESDTAWTIDFV
ncbi:MAG: AAA family ATPase, partial [bacterium]|nr:AAA family ATPase [bacterium]